MILTFRPIKVRPAHWKPASAGRPHSPFDTEYRITLQQLDRELHHLGATEVFLQVEAGSDGVRLDGQLRANVTVDHPGVILSIETRKLGTLVYETDRYTRRWGMNARPAWQENLRAITLGLEALRKVERYGIAQRGQQYAGYRELGSGGPLAMEAGLTFEQAAAFIAKHAWGPDVDPQEVIDDLDVAYRLAAKTLHPDAGGDPELFKTLGQARDLLEGEIGPG